MLEKSTREDAINAFNTINGQEYKCALAEAQVNETLFNQVKKEYTIAENAFLQGVEWAKAHQIKEDYRLILNILATYEKLYRNKGNATKGITSMVAGMQLEAVVQIKNAISKVYNKLNKTK